MRTTALQGRASGAHREPLAASDTMAVPRASQAPDHQTLMQVHPQQIGLPAACSMPALSSQLPKLLG